jgi:hypothetical protein
MVVFFAAMLVVALRTVMAGEPTMEAGVDVDPGNDDAQAPDQTETTPATPTQASAGAQIWTADELDILKPVSYPVPPVANIAPDAYDESESPSSTRGYSSGPPNVVSVSPFIY